MAQARRKFDEDFKQGAVRLVRETGKPIAQVTRELGVNKRTLGNWCAQDQRRHSDGRLTEAKRDELARLRKENAELRMRCDVLKRSAAPLGRGCDAALAVAGFIAAQRDQLQIPHAAACRALGVSPAWFYKWRDGDASVRRSRPQLAIEIARIFATHHGSYGSPRITAELREVRCGSRRTP